MLTRWIVGYALFAGIVAVSGCGKNEPVATGPKGIFDAKCAKCHAQAGEPGGPPGVGSSKGPSLAKIGSEPNHTAEYIAAFIRNPQSVKQNAKMPAFGNSLSDAEIQELAEWLAKKK